MIEDIEMNRKERNYRHTASCLNCKHRIISGMGGKPWFFCGRDAGSKVLDELSDDEKVNFAVNTDMICDAYEKSQLQTVVRDDGAMIVTRAS